jgi:hypothetical protein
MEDLSKNKTQSGIPSSQDESQVLATTTTYLVERLLLNLELNSRAHPHIRMLEWGTGCEYSGRGRGITV